MQLQKEVKPYPAIKKCAALKKEGYCEKRCEIQSCGQEMAVVVG